MLLRYALIPRGRPVLDVHSKVFSGIHFTAHRNPGLNVRQLSRTTALGSKLPQKIEIGIDEKPVEQSTYLDSHRPATEVWQTVPDSNIPQHVLKWSQAPRTVLIVKKVDDPRSHTPFIDVARWLQREYPSLNIVVEPEIASEFRNLVPNLQVIPKDEYSRAIDYVITLGGDGTILHASSVFPHAVPPFISFSLGTLGFLLPFEFSDYSIALRKLMNGHVPLLLRMRLKCEIYGKDGQKMPIKGRSDDFQAMNDITLHRGRNSHLTVIDCSVEGEFLTDAVADGLIVSTPTGSTAYSLSAGGPIVHPAVQSILITPICPRSLSFRPALLPSNVKIRLQLSKRSRGTAELTVDGQDIHILGREEFVEVQVSRFPIPCVSRTYNGGDWVKDINQTLKWNQRFATRLEDD